MYIANRVLIKPSDCYTEFSKASWYNSDFMDYEYFIRERHIQYSCGRIFVMSQSNLTVVDTAALEISHECGTRALLCNVHAQYAKPMQLQYACSIAKCTYELE